MIFKNEASEILRKDPRKVTAGEAHDIYKIFYIVRECAKSFVEPKRFDVFSMTKAEDFTEIIRALRSWYGKVSKTIESGFYGNYLFSLPFSFDYLSTKYALAVYDELFDLVGAVNEINDVMRRSFRRLPDDYRIRRSRPTEANFDDIPECSVLKSDGFEFNFPVAPLLGITQGEKLPLIPHGAPMGKYETLRIGELMNKDISPREADQIFVFLCFSQAFKGRNENTVKGLAEWYARMRDDDLSTLPLFETDLPFNGTLRKMRAKAEKTNLIHKMEIYGLKVDDFPPGVNARLFGSKTMRLIIDRAGMCRRLLGDLVDRLVPVEISRIYYPKLQDHDDLVSHAKYRIVRDAKVPLVITFAETEKYLILKEDRKRLEKYLKVPAGQVEVKRKTIEDYVSAVKYVADMKEDREKALADDCWLEVER